MTFSTLRSVDKKWTFWTAPPPLVNVVCERPLPQESYLVTQKFIKYVDLIVSFFHHLCTYLYSIMDTFYSLCGQFGTFLDHPPHLFHVVIERSHISTGIWDKALIRNLFFFSEMDFHLRRKIRQVSIIRPNSLCFLLPPALSKKTMAAPQLTMLVLQIFSSILWIEVGFCFNVSQSRWICKTWF